MTGRGTNGLVSTSPSIYARFDVIQAGDLCESTEVVQIVFTFTPGELSTLAGPVHLSGPLPPARAFNFADLPCPPQSIMVFECPQMRE